MSMKRRTGFLGYISAIYPSPVVSSGIFPIPGSFRPCGASIASIDVYRSFVSPVLARTGLARCLYTPTCSAYGREAIRRYGFPKGSVLAVRRVLRCNPWSRGGEDPVP